MMENNQRENAKRIPHDYKEGDLVSKEIPGIKPKLSAPREGPYRVEKVYSNGTIRIRRGHVSERINIRRVQPYHQREGDEEEE